MDTGQKIEILLFLCDSDINLFSINVFLKL
jgi:hypothetical protein